MNQLFLDTSILVEICRGNSAYNLILDEWEGDVVIASCCWTELCVGYYLSGKKAEKERMMQIPERLTIIEGLSTVTAWQFGKIKATLIKKGILIEDLDILVAALCIEQRATLLTLNEKHFQRIPELILYEKSNN